MKTVNLDALETMQPIVEKGGIPYAVRPITPLIASMLDSAINATDEQKGALYYDVVAKLIPTMKRVDVDDLSGVQILAILDLAGEQIAQVQDAAGARPKAASPAKRQRRART